MIKITSYIEVSYPDLISALSKQQATSSKSDIQIAADIEVKTPATVKNAFNKEGQIVSDKVLTDIMCSIGLIGFVVWVAGIRKYFISNK